MQKNFRIALIVASLLIPQYSSGIAFSSFKDFSFLTRSLDGKKCLLLGIAGFVLYVFYFYKKHATPVDAPKNQPKADENPDRYDLQYEKQSSQETVYKMQLYIPEEETIKNSVLIQLMYTNIATVCNVDAIVNGTSTSLSLIELTSKEINQGSMTTQERKEHKNNPKYVSPLQQSLYDFPVLEEGEKTAELRCKVGNAVITESFELSKKGIQKIIHAVGPIVKKQSEPTEQEKELLRSAYQKSCQLAVDNNLKSIAFSSISSTIFGYPTVNAAPVAITAVLDYVAQHNQQHQFNKICFVLYSITDFNIYKATMQQITLKKSGL